MRPCQIIYFILLHILWPLQNKFGYKKLHWFSRLVKRYTKVFPNCYYAEEPQTEWDPIP